MEGLAGLAPLAGTSFASPRWRLCSPRPTPRDHRETASRPHSGRTVIVAASGPQHYSSVALPSAFRAPNCRQLPVVTADVAEKQPASWSMQSGGRTLIHTNPMELSFEALIRNPIAWLLRLITRLQSMFAQLFSGSMKRGPMQNCISSPHEPAAATSNRASAASASCTTRRCSSGRYVPAAASKGCSRETATATMTTTRLMATQTPPAATGQRSALPLAALALATAAALGCGGVYMYKRWQATMAGKRETEQRMAVKKDSLARQKQRFQRALVVDSVNLELPPIKDMDVQPGPVQVEKIISQQGSPGGSRPSNPQRASQIPGLAGESLRQWQQFMSASKTKEVTNLSGPRGGRGAAEPPVEEQRPYVALDDRMLADLSERIRKANELTAAGGAAPPMPVITFEELYANKTESDEAAMARRAAERKARWQKQQPGAGGAAPRSDVPPQGPRTEKPATTIASAPPSTSSSLSAKGARGESLHGGRDAASVPAAPSTTFPAETHVGTSRLAAADKPDSVAATAATGSCSTSSRFASAAPVAATEKAEDNARGFRKASQRSRAADRPDATASNPGAGPHSSSTSGGGDSRAAGDGKEDISVAYNLQEARAKVLNANNPFAKGLFNGPSSDDDPVKPIATSSANNNNIKKPTRTGSTTRQQQQATSQAQSSQQAPPSWAEAASPASGASGAGSIGSRLSEAAPTSMSASSRRAETTPLSASVPGRDADVGRVAPVASRSPGPKSVVQEAGKPGSPGRGDRPPGVTVREANAQTLTADDGSTARPCVSTSEEKHDVADMKGSSLPSSAFSSMPDADVVVVPLQSPAELAAVANREKRVPSGGQLRKPETHDPGLVRLMRRPTAAVAVGLQDKERGGSTSDGYLAEQLQ